jgi:hypothetical protein
MSVSLVPKPEPVTVIEPPGDPLVWLIVIPGPTRKSTPVTEPAVVVEPYAPIVWEPEAEDGTTKVAFQPPVELAEIAEETTVPSKVITIPVSLTLKPEPVTVIEVPGGPLAGLMATPELTVKVMTGTESAEVVEPYAPIAWEPEAEAGTTKVVFQPPEELAEIPDLTTVPSKVIATDSEALKPEPVTVTEVPGGPLVRLIVIVALSTVKMAVAALEEEPVATMV